MKFKLNFLKYYQSKSNKHIKRFSLVKILISLAFIITISAVLYLPPEKSILDSKLKVGDIAKEDIIIKKDITVEDKENTQINRKNAIENVVPVYEYYSENLEKIHNLINEWYLLLKQFRIQYIKNRDELPRIKQTIEKKFGIEIPEKNLKYFLASNIFYKIDLDQFFGFIASIEKTGIVASKVGARKSNAGTIRVKAKNREPELIRVDKIHDLRETEILLRTFLKDQGLSAKDIEMISPIFMDFIDVNLAYSITLTREEENRVATQVNPVIIKLKAGKVILRKGDEAKADDLKIMQLIAAAQRTREKKISPFYLIIALMGFLFVFICGLFRSWHSKDLNREKLFLVTGITLFLSAVIYRTSIFLFPLILKNISMQVNYDINSIHFAIPFGFGALIIAFTFNLQSAVIYSFLNSILAGILCDWNLKIALYVLIGNLVISFGIDRYQRIKRSAILKASIFLLIPVNALTILLMNTTHANFDLPQLAFNLLMGCFSAILSPILANFVIPLWEAIFNLINDLKLIELSNLNLPIFREMLEKAPGTYHHSQMVASLSETAALDLNLSPYLLTAMALYHDIGKIENPQLFTENNTVYPDNPHDKLSPQESAKMIISHISDGRELAKKMKIPQIVSSAITQHHGLKLVRFFYEKALEMADVETEDVDEKVFRYPGEKPQDIENAIIMLADQVEAASKSLAAPSDEEIQNVIQKIIDINIEENQFDECDGLTFKSLNMIASGFLKKLSSIYHTRISYPGINFKENNGSDQNHKQQS